MHCFQRPVSSRFRPLRTRGPDEITKLRSEQKLPPPQEPTGIALMRFDMSARPVQDVVLRRLTFEAVQGSLFNAGHYSLWVDHDRSGGVETPLQTGVAPDGGVVSFGQLAGGGYVVTEQTVTFEVRAEISRSPQTSTLQLRFADNGLFAEELDGETLEDHVQIVQHPTPAKVFTILPHGSLYVSTSSVPVRSHQLLGGSVSDPLLRLTFRADDEDIEVTNLRISSSGSTARSVQLLELLREGENRPFGSARSGACGTDDVLTMHPLDSTLIEAFCVQFPSGTLVIPENERVDVLVRAAMHTDEEGGVSGEIIQLWLTGQAVAAHSTGSGSVRARGRSSSEVLDANNGDSIAEGELLIGRDSAGPNKDIVGPSHFSTLSRIASISNGQLDQNVAPVPAGMSTLGAFTFEAAPNANTAHGSNSVVLDGIIFTVSATNVMLSAPTFSIVNNKNQSAEAACTALSTAGSSLSGDITGAFLVHCASLRSSALATSIDSGGSATFSLKGKVVNTKLSASTSSSLHISLQNFSSPKMSFGAQESHIHWVDSDAAGRTNHFFLDLPQTEVRSALYQS